MSQEVKLVEIAGGLIWAASAVAVAGYTFDAFKETYNQFPGILGGFGQTAPVPPSVQKGDNSIGAPNLPRNKNFPLATAGVAASPPAAAQAGWISKIPIIGPLFADAVGAGTPQPPKNNRPARAYDRAIANAVQNRNKQQALTITNQVWRQQQKRGWSKQDFQDWIGSRPYANNLYNLLGSK